MTPEIEVHRLLPMTMMKECWWRGRQWESKRNWEEGSWITKRSEEADKPKNHFAQRNSKGSLSNLWSSLNLEHDWCQNERWCCCSYLHENRNQCNIIFLLQSRFLRQQSSFIRYHHASLMQVGKNQLPTEMMYETYPCNKWLWKRLELLAFHSIRYQRKSQWEINKTLSFAKSILYIHNRHVVSLRDRKKDTSSVTSSLKSCFFLRNRTDV